MLTRRSLFGLLLAPLVAPWVRVHGNRQPGPVLPGRWMTVDESLLRDDPEGYWRRYIGCSGAGMHDMLIHGRDLRRTNGL